MKMDSIDMDNFDLALNIQRLIKKAPYGKLDISIITQNSIIIESDVSVTNKILVRKGQNALILLSSQVVNILEEQINGKFTVEFAFKNKEVYKLIIKFNKKINNV